MKVVILAGGLPSTISEDNDRIPKPMVEIGERPILWHIMKLYSHYGLNDFIICTGYKGDLVKQYFLDYYIYRSDITVDLENNKIDIHNNKAEPWNVTIVDTGLTASTAERVKRVQSYIDCEDFIISYGDCLSNINISHFLQYHKEKGKMMTAAVAKPTGRNLVLNLSQDGSILSDLSSFNSEAEAWVNACNLIVNRKIFSYLKSTKDRFEVETINKITKDNQITTYKHYGFWSPVETMRDKIILENAWNEQKAPWKIWVD
jgi:glucose-1-phosphate cytidylyltransferase